MENLNQKVKETKYDVVRPKLQQKLYFPDSLKRCLFVRTISTSFEKKDRFLIYVIFELHSGMGTQGEKAENVKPQRNLKLALSHHPVFR